LLLVLFSIHRSYRAARLQAAASHLLSVGRAAKSASSGAGTDADSLKISAEIKNEASGNQSFDSHITGE